MECMVKENVPIEDEKFDIKVYKNYTKKMAAPYDLCHRKHNDERIYVDVNIKNIVKNSILIHLLILTLIFLDRWNIKGMTYI